MENTINLSLGPLLYYWPQATIQRFYAAVSTWPVERVYLGEVVCSRRHEMRLNDWLDIAATLQAAGKTVVLSSQALLESGGDLIALRKLANAGFLIEANDPGAVKVAADAGLPFVAGPHLNIYSGATLDWYVGLGACRWVHRWKSAAIRSMPYAPRASIWCRSNCLRMVICRWRGQRAALPPAITIAIKIAANLSAWNIRTAW